jgi:hypothetical protein
MISPKHEIAVHLPDQFSGIENAGGEDAVRMSVAINQSLFAQPRDQHDDEKGTMGSHATPPLCARKCGCSSYVTTEQRWSNG